LFIFFGWIFDFRLRTQLKTMTELPIIVETRALINKEFELNIPEQVDTHEALIEVMADVLADMIEHRLEQLFTTLYLIDVDERKVQAVLTPGNPEPAKISLAKLIVERQERKVISRRKYQDQPGDGWAD
jgi:hypothetical protein